MGSVIYANGGVEVLRPEGGAKKYGLAQLQKIVGGFIELVYLGQEVMVVDEEGLLKNRAANHRASEIAGRHIVGDVALIPSNSIE